MGAGIKKSQEKGEAEMTKELTQTNDMNVFCPINRDSLTREEKAKVLASLMFKGEMGQDGQGVYAH
jgi:hypothetical protein